jgi:hypothetical protein
MGATPSWIVSVENVGADDARNGNSDKLIRPRMMAEEDKGIKEDDVAVCLRR